MKLPQGTLGAYSVYALLVLFSANFLNYMDRNVFASIQSNVRTSMDLNDGQIGWITSAFTIGYMVTVPFIGALADRMRRTWVLGAAVIVWSLATMACGLSDSFWSLFIPRFLIGIGEAGCLAVGPALAADYFQRSQRGRALGFFFLGLPVGGAAGYVVGGLLAKQPWSWGPLTEGWQWAFLAAGAPGLVLGVVAMLLREPPRGQGEDGHTLPLAGLTSYLEIFRTRTFLLIVIAQACAAAVLTPLSTWGPRFLEEYKHLSKGESTVLMGIVALVAGIGGTTLGGWLGDRLAKRESGSYALVAGFGFAIAYGALMVGILAPAKALFIPAFVVAFAMFFGCMPSVNAQIANVTHASQRSMAFALATFGTHLIGDAPSSVLFGKLTDRVGLDTMFTVFPALVILASIFCFLARATARKDVERVLSS